MRHHGGSNAVVCWIALCASSSIAFAQSIAPLDDDLMDRLGQTDGAQWPQVLQEGVDDGEMDNDTALGVLALREQPVSINDATVDGLLVVPGMILPWAEALIGARPSDGYSSMDEVHAVASSIGVDALTWSVVRQCIAVHHMPERLHVRMQHAVTGSTHTPENTASMLYAPWPRGMLRTDLTLVRGGDLSAHPWHVDGHVLMQLQPIRHAQWDAVRGVMVASQHSINPTWQAGVQIKKSPWTLTVGHYLAGFAETLVFAHAASINTNALDKTIVLNRRMRVGLRDGTWVTQPGAWGGALGWTDALTDRDRLHVTTGMSVGQRDVYQYDIQYGVDAWYGDGTCTRDADCPQNYTCDGAQHQCVSHQFVRADDPNTELRYLSLNNGAREWLGFGNVTWTHDLGRDDPHHVHQWRAGITTYGSAVDLLWDPQGPDVQYAPNAAYPERARFGALGIFGAYRNDAWQLSAEIARMDNGSYGATGRGLWQPARGGLHAVMQWRVLGKDFDNPHNHGVSAPDQTLGNRARNEAGIRHTWVVRGQGAWQPWRWHNHVDMWRALDATPWGTTASSALRWRAHTWGSIGARGWIRHAARQPWRYGWIGTWRIAQRRRQHRPAWSFAPQVMLQWDRQSDDPREIPSVTKFRVRGALEVMRGTQALLSAGYRYDRRFNDPQHGWEVMVTWVQTLASQWWIQVRYGVFGHGGVGSVSPQVWSQAGFVLLQWQWSQR